MSEELDKMGMKKKGEYVETMISDLLADGDNLSKTGLSFVESIANQYGERGWLFPKQAEALESIWSEQFGFARNR